MWGFTMYKAFHVQLSGENMGFKTGKWATFLQNISVFIMCQFGRWISKRRHSFLDLPRSSTKVAPHCGRSSHISWFKLRDTLVDDLQDLWLGWHFLILWSWRQPIFLLYFFLDRTVLKSFSGGEVLYIRGHCTPGLPCLPNCVFR